MTALQRIQLAQSEARSRLQEIAGIDEVTDEIREEVKTLKAELSDLEVRNQAALVSETNATKANERRFQANDSEGRELRELRGRVSVARYLGAAIETRSVEGAEGEYNEALGMDRTQFPLRLLSLSEVRADTATDAGATQGTWLDRIFGDTAGVVHRMRVQVRGAGHRHLSGHDRRGDRRAAWQGAGRGRRGVDRGGYRPVADEKRRPSHLQHGGFRPAHGLGRGVAARPVYGDGRRHR